MKILLQYDTTQAIKSACTTGVFYYIAMTIFIIIYDKQVTKKFSNGKFVEPKQNRTIITELTSGESFELCLKKLENIKAKIEESDQSRFYIKALINKNWHHPGEILEIQIKESSDNQTNINVVSSPASSETTVDFGAGWKNVEMISNLFKINFVTI